MSLDIQKSTREHYSIIKVLTLTILSFALMALSAYTSHIFLIEMTRFNLTALEKQIVVVASSVGLPLACLIVSQTLISTRGLNNAVKAVLIGSVITLLAHAPYAMQLLA